jgi:hypothetical protein
MQPALDSTIMDRLAALGRKQGHLTNQDLQANLPVDAMSAEEIALIVVHLEEAGIPVELDDSLTAPNPKAGPAPVKTAEVIPFPDRAAASRMKRKAGTLQNSAASRADASKASGQKGAAHWAVAGSGLLVLVLLGALVVLFGV